MKRILIFAFCLISCGLLAQVIYQPHRRKDFRISAAACSTYNTTNAWDNFIEGFQTPTTGYESNVWTGVGTTANIFPAADSSTLTTYKPEGACNQALKIVVPTDGTETFIRGDLGAAGTIDLDTVQTDVYFSFYVETGPDANEFYTIFSYRNSTTPTALVILYRTGAGQLQTGVGASSFNINQGQWYVGKLSFDIAGAANGSSYTVWSNGSQVSSVTFTRGAGTDLRYLFVGPCVNLDSGDSGTVWFDLICVKTN